MTTTTWLGKAPLLPRAWAGPIARLAGAVAMWGLILCALEIVLAAGVGRSFLVPSSLHGGFAPWLRGPLGGPGDKLDPTAFSALLVAMVACYAVAVACAGRLPATWVLATVATLHVLFLIAPPLLSTDIFSYVAYARMGALHALNPYQFGPLVIRDDPSFLFVGGLWRTTPTVYGPLFTLGSYATAPLGVAGALWALKASAAAASAGLVALTWSQARRSGRPPGPAVALIGLNPVLLVYAVGGGHNDLLMMLLAGVGIACVLAGREGFGGAALVAAVAVKLTAGLFLPFALAGARRRSRLLLGAALAAAILAVVAFAVFGTRPLGVVAGLRAEQGHATFQTVLGFLFNHLGLGRVPSTATHAATAAFAAVTLGALVRAGRGGDWVAAAGWASLALLLATQWLLPWYVVWLLPLAALGADRRLRVAAVAMTVLVVAIHTTHWLLPRESRAHAQLVAGTRLVR